MFPVLKLLGLTVQTYPFALILAVGAGLWLSERTARTLGLDADSVNNLGFYALLATVLGARLAYVVTHWSAYRDALLSIFSLTPTALSWPGGAAIGVLVAFVYWRRQQLPVGATLDAFAPGLATALAVERLGAFLGGVSLGRPTTLPWGVYLWDQVRHPVQLYEMVALLLILGILLWQRARRSFAGHLFVLFVALYAGARLFLEAFRAQTPLVAGGVRAIQVGALVTIMGAVWYLYHRRFALARDEAGVTSETEQLDHSRDA
jgi:phosphatidylglycerol:prolipoprotein diacylglycerol transferase